MLDDNGMAMFGVGKHLAGRYLEGECGINFPYNFFSASASPLHPR